MSLPWTDSKHSTAHKPWSEAEIILLQDMFNADLLYREIASVLGRSITAITLKLSKLNLSRKNSKRWRPLPTTPIKVPRQPTTIKEPASLNVNIIDLEANECKFATSESPYTFCGHQTDGGPWCDHHKQRCTQIAGEYNG